MGKRNITCVINGGNIKYLEHILSVRKYVKAIRFQLENFLYPWQATKEFPVDMQIKLDIGYSFMDLKQAITRLPNWIFTQPKYLKDNLYNCFMHDNRNYKKFGCVYMFRGRIEPNGDMSFCPFIKKVFGNALKQNPRDVWNSKELRKFRINLIKRNFLSVCENCCSSRVMKGKIK